MDKINGHTIDGIIIMGPDEFNKLSVSVSVSPIEESGKEIRITTRELRNFLIYEKGFSLGVCLQSAIVTNTNEGSRLGTWVFECENTNKSKALKELTQLTEEFGGYESENRTLNVTSQISQESLKKSKKVKKSLLVDTSNEEVFTNEED